MRARMLPMLRAALLLALLSAPLAHARDWAKATCEDDFASCREDCSMADGTDLNSQGRLQRCLTDCKQEDQKCEFKRFDAQRRASLPKATVVAGPAVSVDGEQVQSKIEPVKPRRSNLDASAHRASPSIDPGLDLQPRADFTVRASPPGRHTSLPTSELAGAPSSAPVVTAPNYDRIGPAHAAASTSTVPHDSLPIAKTTLPGDSVDDLLDKPPSSTSGQATASDEAPAPPPAPTKPAKKPAPPKKDLSEWDPGALD